MEKTLGQDDTSTNSTLRMQTIRTVEDLAAIAPAWDRLFALAGNATPALHRQWIINWWEAFGPEYGRTNDPLSVICIWRGKDLVGMLPLYWRRPKRLGDGGFRLCFIGTGESERDEICPDYLDLLCLDEAAGTCAELTWRRLCDDREQAYDRLELCDMPDDSAMVQWARQNGQQHHLEISPRGACPIADLAGGFEAYLAGLSANGRQQGRKLLRQAEAAGVCFEVAQTPEEAEVFFGEMVELHQRRWQAVGEPGCFSSAPFTAFHRQLIRQWQPSGQAILSRLRLGGRTLAVKYGFRVGVKYDFYQSGVQCEDAPGVKSPGIVSFLLLMRHLSEHGVQTFDFLRGSSQYKQRLATTAQPLLRVRRVRWTWRTALSLIADLGIRGLRKLLRGVFRATKNKRDGRNHGGAE